MSALTYADSIEDDDVERGSAAVLAAARAATADIALITDANQLITFVSASFTSMTGYEPADMMGRNCRFLQGPGTDRATVDQMSGVLASGKVFEGQILNYRKDGPAFWCALKILPMRVGGGTRITHFVSIQRDISNKVALLKQLEALALHDQVTGLPNRTAAEQALDEALRRPPYGDSITAVGLIDFDDFRTVNNTFGHAAGDAVLRQWAPRMLSRLREGDVLARMGGDEFLLILGAIPRNTVIDHLSGMLERVHGAVEEPFLVDGGQVQLEMSMGIAFVPDDGADSSSVLRRADEALYSVKGRGAGASWWETTAYSYAHPINSADDRGRSIGRHRGEGAGQEDYRSALRNGNVLVHLQPVVDLRDGTIHLFEALARLRLPGGRIAHPDEFLHHFETDDQRVLFSCVLDQALAALASWDREGSSHAVSVNLPPEILQEGSTAAIVAGQLESHGIPPGRLGLELLESQTMDLETQRAALQELVALGVGLAMDDLGSGHSSLQRLSSFPFSAIKVDRGLLLHAHDKPLETLSVMATLIQMGRDLGMNTVIEGLEDEGLTEAAIIFGAPLGQGYYFAQPMAAGECLPWVHAFAFGLHRSPIRTSLGALAYHWQFARLAAPHPLDLPECPLTRFINEMEPDTEATAWHILQHSREKMHPASSRALIDWLTHHIRSPKPRDRSTDTHT